MSWLLPSIPGWSRTTPASTSTSQPDPNTSSSIAQNDIDDLDLPPPFPLLNSVQRSQLSQRTDPNQTPSFAMSPPSPPRRSSSLSEEDEPSSLNIAIADTPLGNMLPPPSTTVRPTFGMSQGGNDEDRVKSGLDGNENGINGASLGVGGLGDNGMTTKKKKSGKVPLAPGHSPLDWARLCSSGQNLKGVSGFVRVTPTELAKHKTKEDAWSVFNGKVYNLTPYLDFHPGGVDQLMRVAGRDGTKLFMNTHSWVNMEFMMQECLVGMMVRG